MMMMADALSQLHGAECLILLSISCSNQKTPYPRNTGRNKPGGSRQLQCWMH